MSKQVSQQASQQEPQIQVLAYSMRKCLLETDRRGGNTSSCLDAASAENRSQCRDAVSFFGAPSLRLAALWQVVAVAGVVEEVEVVALVEAAHLVEVRGAQVCLRVELGLWRQAQQPHAQVRLPHQALRCMQRCEPLCAGMNREEWSSQAGSGAGAFVIMASSTHSIKVAYSCIQLHGLHLHKL